MRSLVPPTSLIRFKTVCKRWNDLFNDKAFINNHKMTFQFVLATRSKIYSVSINPNIVVRELTLGLKSQIPIDLVDCNEFLLCGMADGAMVCNPWLRETRCIEVNEPHLTFVGIGYDNNNKRVKEIVYKILYCYSKEYFYTCEWKIHDFVSDAWEDQKLEKAKYTTLPIRTSTQGECFANLLSSRGVSLNGTFYWVAIIVTRLIPRSS
ncbi:putative F-box/kelch-repeat protein [Cardamine amara subsp. amara]|uniref:F-box/kelch-repeat protein n=1 Tax=Cardamine amara subsp. amara TaxID=228776 RepID=A0ABD1B4D9_CARAN